MIMMMIMDDQSPDKYHDFWALLLGKKGQTNLGRGQPPLSKVLISLSLVIFFILSCVFKAFQISSDYSGVWIEGKCNRWIFSSPPTKPLFDFCCKLLSHNISKSIGRASRISFRSWSWQWWQSGCTTKHSHNSHSLAPASSYHTGRNVLPCDFFQQESINCMAFLGLIKILH